MKASKNQERRKRYWKGAAVSFSTQGKLRPKRKNIVATVYNFELVIRRLTYNFYVTEKQTESEIATSCHLRKQQFQDISKKILDEVGFRVLNPFLHTRFSIIFFSSVYVDEMYFHSSHTALHEWTDGSGERVKAPLNKRHQIIIHAR